MEDVVDTSKIGFVGFRQIVGTGAGNVGTERLDIVNRAGIGATACVSRAEEINPHRIEAERSAVGEKGGRFSFGEVDDECLRRIADHQKRNIVLVDKVAVVSAFFDGIGGCRRRGRCQSN